MSGPYLRMPLTWQADPLFRHGLSAEAFRTYVMATLFCGKERSDGWLDEYQAMSITVGSADDEKKQIWAELIEAGLAEESVVTVRKYKQHGYRLVEYLEEQLPASHWESKKANAAERKRRERARKKEQDAPASASARGVNGHEVRAGRSYQDSPTLIDAAPTSGGNGQYSWDVPRHA